MEWAKTAADPSIQFNLAGSGFNYTDPAVLAPDLARMALAGPNEYGAESVRARVAARYQVPPEHVLPVAGTSLGLFLAAAALLEGEGEALVESPTYEPVLRVAQVFGTRVHRLERRFEDGYRVDLDRLAGALTPQTRLVALCDLHNPSGRTLGPATRQGLLDLAARRGFTLLVDEVYRDFLETEPIGTIYRPGAPVVVVSSLTKVYGMGGIRAGWMLGAPELLRRASRMVDLLHVIDPYAMLPIIEAAFDHADSLREVGLNTARAGRAVLNLWMGSRGDLEWVEPDAGLTAFPRLPAGLTGSEVSRRLKAEEGTLVVPGRFFEDDRHFRVGVGGGPNVVAEGLQRLGRILDRMSAR